jgi:hypothetical protein
MEALAHLVLHVRLESDFEDVPKRRCIGPEIPRKTIDLEAIILIQRDVGQ